MKEAYGLSLLGIVIVSILFLGIGNIQTAKAVKIDTTYYQTGKVNLPIGTHEGYSKQIIAKCPLPTQQVTGGGYSIHEGNILVTDSSPRWSGKVDEWAIQAWAPKILNTPPPSVPPSISAWVLCSNMVP